MSVTEDADRLRAMSDFTMAMAAVEQVKSELFEAESQAAQVLEGHPMMADISGPSERARAVADDLTAALATVSGAFVGVADTLMRGQ